MLLRFACKNHRSLRDEQELSLIATSGHEHEESVLVASAIKQRVLRSAAIYGANASGKTSVLRAIAFMDWAVESSHKEWSPDGKIPRDRFRFEDGASLPSYYELDFLLGEKRFTYGFELNDVEIIREWLYAFPVGRKVVWFERERGQPIDFGRSLIGKNRVIEELMRKNSLFLSTAAQNNHKQLSEVAKWFRRNFNRVVPENKNPISTAEMCLKSPEIKQGIKPLLEFADLGISDIKIEERELDETIKDLVDFMAKQRKIERPVGEVPTTVPELSLLHRGAGGKDYEIKAEEESSGTISYLCTLGPVLRALENGTVLLIDELESSLHPSLARELVRLFNDPGINCKGAQFIFTTHDANLLDLDILRRDQIWFTEKDRQGRTSLYPLTKFQIRADYNVARGYLQGRFGAIPFLNSALLGELQRMGCE